MLGQWDFLYLEWILTECDEHDDEWIKQSLHTDFRSCCRGKTIQSSDQSAIQADLWSLLLSDHAPLEREKGGLQGFIYFMADRDSRWRANYNPSDVYRIDLYCHCFRKKQLNTDSSSLFDE